ncbi:hypothetical protein TvY486_0030490 [Trypanosoma vivax Y486]|uniref:Uncharacterized protein n=1 Tax=Trypanosoma vivax (strain Y486) TaxID=1055687 RepID=F9WRT9_TRYVY|nr:hypothetical protein TvY486_0030490 [Trypanosoma vivax Y486]|eukprot:CCD20273.1 hypothetical protein TvY486_0030490 [Trypanosoma vivax Y486]
MLPTLSKSLATAVHIYFAYWPSNSSMVLYLRLFSPLELIRGNFSKNAHQFLSYEARCRPPVIMLRNTIFFLHRSVPLSPAPDFICYKCGGLPSLLKKQAEWDQCFVGLVLHGKAGERPSCSPTTENTRPEFPAPPVSLNGKHPFLPPWSPLSIPSRVCRLKNAFQHNAQVPDVFRSSSQLKISIYIVNFSLTLGSASSPLHSGLTFYLCITKTLAPFHSLPFISARAPSCYVVLLSPWPKAKGLKGIRLFHGSASPD